MESRRHFAHIIGQADEAAFAETRTRFAGIGIERYHARIAGGGDDAVWALRSCGSFEISDTSAGFENIGAGIAVGIELPIFLARRGVDRKYHSVRRAEIEAVADFYRRRFKINIPVLFLYLLPWAYRRCGTPAIF